MLFITVGAKSAVWIKKSCRLKCQLFDFIGKHTMLLGRKFWDCRNKEEEYLNINIFNKELAQAKRTLNRANRKNLLSARDRNSRFSPLRAWHDKNAAFPCIKKTHDRANSKTLLFTLIYDAKQRWHFARANASLSSANSQFLNSSGLMSITLRVIAWRPLNSYNKKLLYLYSDSHLFGW